MPLLFWYPEGIGEGSRFRTPVNTTSLLPTMLSLAGFAVPDEVDAGSLKASLENGAEPPAAPVFSEISFGYRGYRDNDRLVMVRHGDDKLTLFQDPADPATFSARPEGSLYNLRADPGERRNLFELPEHRATVSRLVRAITNWDRWQRGPDSA